MKSTNFGSVKKERILYLLFLVIAASILIQAFKDPATLTSLEVKRYWINKTHAKKEFPVVFGGDSRIYRGISPDAFAAEYPMLSAVNLGYSSNGFHPEYLDFLEERLDEHAENKVIVLGISPHNFTDRGFKSEHYISEKHDRKKEEVLQYLYFYELNRLLAPMQIMEVFRRDEAAKLPNEQYVYHKNGWMESWFLEPDTTRMWPVFSRTFANNEYNDKNAGVFLRQVREWTAEGIYVIAFRNLASKTVRALEDSLSGMNFELFSESFEKAGGIWLDFERSKYPTYDGSHLDHDAARIFSSDLAIEVNKILTMNN